MGAGHGRRAFEPPRSGFKMSPEAVAEAQERGTARDLDATVAELLAELGDETQKAAQEKDGGIVH